MNHYCIPICILLGDRHVRNLLPLQSSEVNFSQLRIPGELFHVFFLARFQILHAQVTM